jgi:hypothetical protein
MPKTKLFFDTEFTGLHQKTTLISIGIISECGKTFYAEFTDYDVTQIDDWLQTNVIKNLKFHNKTGTDLFWNNGDYTEMYGSTELIKYTLEKWLKQFNEVEMWSDCLAYDWVLFNEMFGHAFNIPKNVYYIPFDLCTLLKIKGIDPDISREKLARAGTKEELQKHNALWDAIIIKECYNNIINN